MRVCIDGKDYLCHRLIYIMFFGEIPHGYQIDHKDEIKDNNNISNLRIATNSQNKMNSTKHTDNKSGIKGVSWKKANNKWQVSICVNNINKYIGLFETKGEAAKAYKESSVFYHKEFSKI